MSPASELRRAAEAAARRRRVRATGRRAAATIIAVRRLAVVEGAVTHVELDLDVRFERSGPRRRVTVTEALPVVLARQAQPGTQLDVVVGVDDDELVIEWSG